MTWKHLLEAVALYKATRSIAIEHAALRTRQLETYKKTSSLARGLASQTGRIASTATTASASSGRTQGGSLNHSVQKSSNARKKENAQVPSHDSVQGSERIPVTKEGLEQDHFYEPSKLNSTTQPPPEQSVSVQQKAAKRNPLPDGSIPSLERQLGAPLQDSESYSEPPQTAPTKQPLSESAGQTGEKLEPTSSGKSTIPDPSNESTLPSPEHARKLQRAAEKQIPSQAAEPPPAAAAASEANAASKEQSAGTELGVDQERDVFYTPSRNISRVLSALPRVKIPKNTMDEQHSAEPISDELMNQDVFYTSHADQQSQTVPNQQALPQQDEPSDGMYSELFHSPKVAKMLQGRPSPVNASKGLELQGVKGTPIEDDRSTSAGDPESFSTRPTQGGEYTAAKAQASRDPATSSNSAQHDDMQALAADIAKDATEAPASSDKMSVDGGDAPAKVPFEMHESRVPASRLGRLWQYGGLATSMAFGAVGESFRRVTGSGDANAGSLMLSASNMERLVAKLSRMRGAALKIGQMMSFQDSKMLPAPIHEVLQRVQDSADYMPASQRNQVLASNLGSDWRDLFSSFDERPIAAASIGQVHSATMKSSGTRVAVKVQYPGVADSIDSDLNNIAILLTASRLLPKGLYLEKTIANARTELAWECDYIREAECGRRFKKLLRDEQDTFVVPSVIDEASEAQVLTAEMMNGIGVTKAKHFTQEQKDWIGTQILRLCLREILEFKFMQTDPNWTNFLYNSDTSKLELLDFGASRDYPDKFIVPYVQILRAASRNDRDTIRDRSIDLGYLTGHESQAMLNAHVSSVLTLAEPFMDSSPEVYDFRDQTITDRVRGLIPVMVRERLAPPPEETYSLHRKLSGAFLLCARLGSRVRCRELFANAMAKIDHPATSPPRSSLFPFNPRPSNTSSSPQPTPSAYSPKSQNSDRITILDGTIQNPAWVEGNFIKHEIDTVFLGLTGFDELLTSCNFFPSVVHSGCVKHVIYLSACGDVMPEAVFDDKLGGLIPGHVLVKAAVEQMLQWSRAFRADGRTYTILGPSLFCTNVLGGKETMMGMGIYGELIGTKGVSRVDEEDVALAVVKVAEEPEKWNGKKVSIGSKELYTEREFSRFWSEALGKPINVAPNFPEGFDQLEKHMSVGMDLIQMYQLFNDMGFGMTEEEYKTQRALLGKEPSDYEVFDKRAGAEWIKEFEAAE
ncbi:MAG: hypothetical protein Q9184_000219 [Pyrenodesmia sp. 2 TL-2023]